jgi:Na+-transporting NADH:ubiquinone oxidoreductase subunit NqrD
MALSLVGVGIDVRSRIISLAFFRRLVKDLSMFVGLLIIHIIVFAELFDVKVGAPLTI